MVVIYLEMDSFIPQVRDVCHVKFVEFTSLFVIS